MRRGGPSREVARAPVHRRHIREPAMASPLPPAAMALSRVDRLGGIVVRTPHPPPALPARCRGIATASGFAGTSAGEWGLQRAHGSGGSRSGLHSRFLAQRGGTITAWAHRNVTSPFGSKRKRIETRRRCCEASASTPRDEVPPAAPLTTRCELPHPVPKSTGFGRSNLLAPIRIGLGSIKPQSRRRPPSPTPASPPTPSLYRA